LASANKDVTKAACCAARTISALQGAAAHHGIDHLPQHVTTSGHRTFSPS
jgi:hypothetical protein